MDIRNGLIMFNMQDLPKSGHNVLRKKEGDVKHINPLTMFGLL